MVSQNSEEGDSSRPIVVKNGLKRVLRFRDLFFIGVGSQAPLLSNLTYTAIVVSLAGFLSPLIVLLGMALVFVNNLVVVRLSKRIIDAGGFYKYAARYLGITLGSFVGCNFLVYAIPYGSAYILASSYILQVAFGIPWLLSLSAICLVIVVLSYLGVRVSRLYAIITGSIELATLIALSLGLIAVSGFTLENPLTHLAEADPSAVTLAILYAAAIPVGPSVLSPMSEEAKRASRVIGRAIKATVLTGGLLATLFAFSLVTYLDGFLGKYINVGTRYGITPLINILKGVIGNWIAPLILFAIINDGVLGALAFALSTSRTVYAMSRDRLLPSIFAEVESGNPKYAALLVSSLIALLSMVSASLLGLANALFTLSLIAVIADLVMRQFTNVALLRAAKNDIIKMRLVNDWRRSRTLAKRALKDSAISITALTITTFTLLMTIVNTTSQGLIEYAIAMIVAIICMMTQRALLGKRKEDVCL